jgi:hypothetical protein
MAVGVLSCTIEQIAEWHPQLYLEPHAVACVAVMRQHGPSPCRIEVECQNVLSSWLGNADRFWLEVAWSEATEERADRLRRTMQPKPLAELAAIALTCVLTPNAVDLGQLDVTSYGGRADYRSVTIPCVVEMSGTEIPEELSRRHREKVVQALANPFGFGAYVAVCLFASDGFRIRFSYHPREG